MSNITLLNCDCMSYMKGLPDKAFDLAIVDPPYGIGMDWKKRNKGALFLETTYTNNSIPNEAYFNELLRVSKDQIIWGYNYFVQFLGPTNYLIIWDKKSNNNSVFKYSKAEIAYTSKKIPVNLISVPWDGYRMGKETGIKKIHPHQKPIELYSKVLIDYAKSGDKILDTHGGSMSIAIACHEMGFDLTLCEIDKDYYEAGVKRVANAMKQQTLFNYA